MPQTGEPSCPEPGTRCSSRRTCGTAHGKGRPAEPCGEGPAPHGSPAGLLVSRSRVGTSQIPGLQLPSSLLPVLCVRLGGVGSRVRLPKPRHIASFATTSRIATAEEPGDPYSCVKCGTFWPCLTVLQCASCARGRALTPSGTHSAKLFQQKHLS